MTPTDADLRRYLLGQSSTAESEAVESAYFADHAITARLDDLADDLIRAHRAGGLDASDRAAFEQLPDTPARAVRRALVRRFDERAASPSPAVARALFRPMLALAATAVMAVGTWWAITRPEAPVPESRHDEAPAAVSRPVAPLPPPVVIAALILPTTATRSGGPTPTVAVSADVTAVALRLTDALPPLADLTAEIRGVDTPVEWRGIVTPPDVGVPPAIVGEVVLPSDGVPAGDYILTIRRAEETVLRGFFRVVRP